MTEREMFYGAGPDIFRKARELRESMTETEQLLWRELKQNQILGLRFKPQHPISTFIADFYCHKLRLVIEIDGGYHLSIEQREYDLGRDFEMNELGLKVLRFTSLEIENHINSVLKRIEETCSQLKND